MKKNFAKLFLLFFIVTTTLSGCVLSGNNTTAKAVPFTLEIWGVFDSSEAYTDIIAAYKLARPHITVNYKKLRWEEYEKALIEGWAEDKGPDILLIQNTWVGKYQSKLAPMPAKISVPVLITSGTLKKTTQTVVQQVAPLSPTQIKTKFADVVWQDAVRDNQVWGLPLALDTLALFYNRALLDSAGVVEPPKTWPELLEATKKITRQDSDGNIVRSAIALGAGTNISRTADILSLLMMQNGAIMLNNNNVTFDQASTYDQSVAPGVRALEFYTSFSSPSKEVYTWNNKMPEATNAFLQGKVAMMFGYAYQLPLLKAQGQNMNFAVAPMLHLSQDGSDAQPGQTVNFANYWLMSVAKKTKHVNEAWDFILFATTNSYTNKDGQLVYQNENYLKSTGKPPALRALLNKYRQDPTLEPFVSQVLTAKSWYRGADPATMEQAFQQMIDNVVSGKQKPDEAIHFAAQAIKQTYINQAN